MSKMAVATMMAAAAAAAAWWPLQEVLKEVVDWEDERNARTERRRRQ